MAHVRKAAAFTLASTLMLAAFAGPGKFDEKRLTEQGDVYVVALREGYLAHETAAQTRGDAARAAFWHGRARAVERQVAHNDFDVVPLHPVRLDTNDAYRRDVLLNAYQETAALISSEAADEEPVRTAKVQIDFEQWLYDAAHGEDSRAFAQSWDTWDKALSDMVDETPPSDRKDLLGTDDSGRSS